MTAAVRDVATALGPNGLGIADSRQTKLRWKLRKRVKMNYDHFCQESGAALGSDGHWHLPAEPQRKDIADIESKKRSMYRKRYQMLDDLEAALKTHFQTA